MRYDELGNLIEKDLPNGIKEVYTYDDMGRLVRIDYTGTGRSISYSYDSVGNVIEMTDWTGTTTYSYDNIYQLTSATYPGIGTQTYTYDPAGNRIQDNYRTYTYNNLNQLISTSDGTAYTYDLNGNLIQKTKDNQTTTYTWNEFDKLVRVDLPDGREVRFVYGADGLRRERVEEGVRVNYLLDGLVVLCEFVDSGDVLREYVPGVSVSSGGSNFFYHYDRLGSVRFMSDSSGQVVGEYVYDAWGNVVSSSGNLDQPYQYVGEHGYYKEQSLNLFLLGQRWYEAEIGRFISRDPIGEVGGLNLYVYVGNNVMNEVDPYGLEPCICCLRRIFEEATEKSQENRGAMSGLTGEQRDAFRHCYASCRGVEDCGYLYTFAGGWWNEARYWFRSGAREDLYNNAHGRKCAKGIFSCRVCCLIKVKKGILWIPGKSHPKNDSYVSSTGN